MKSFWAEESGGISEYTVLIVMALVIAVGAMAYLAPKIKNVFTSVGSKL